VAALARHVDEVVVVADTIVPAALPPNARARSFHSRTRIGRGARLVWSVARELPGLRRNGAVIAHMISVYVILVAPLVRPLRVPLVLWWVHWKVDLATRTAERLCTRVVSVDRRSFPHPTDKLLTVGQSIDFTNIPVRSLERSPLPGTFRVVAIGRYSPAKQLGTIVRAVEIARSGGVDLELDVYGPAIGQEGETERTALQQLVDELGLVDHVRLHPAVTRPRVIELLGSADVLVNNARGGADRIVYEAGASGIPVLASNPAHADFLDPDAFFAAGDPKDLSARLVAVAALSPAERDEIGRRLRDRVERENSVDSWSRGLLRAAGL
jgi:glycosyltransferase involved in cell wall biosynthesis